MSAFRLIPERLDSELAFLQGAIDTKLNRKGLHGKLSRPAKLARALRKNVKQTLLEPATFIALPIFVVLRTEIDDVFARDIGGTTRRGKHLPLHYGLDLASN